MHGAVRCIMAPAGGPCRATGQHEYAEELLQRCLYALEMAWPPSFRPQAGGCRVAFEEEQNRPLFVALFRHVQARPPEPLAQRLCFVLRLRPPLSVTSCQVKTACVMLLRCM